MEWIVDRIENGYVICEDSKKRMWSIPSYLFPSNIKEGDVVTQTPNNTYIINVKATVERQKSIQKRMNKLWK